MARESERNRIRQAAKRLDEASLRRDYEVYGEAGRPKFRDTFNAAMAIPGLSVQERIARIVEPEEERVERVRRTPTEEYRAAQAEYQESWSALYTPDFLQKLEALKNGDPAGAEAAIAFLEADPWHFHSGYLKQEVARYLRAVPLSQPQARRVQIAILAAIAKGRREDTAQYAKLARRLDDARFRSELAALAIGPDASTATRANRLLAKCRLNDTRADLRALR